MMVRNPYISSRQIKENLVLIKGMSDNNLHWKRNIFKS